MANVFLLVDLMVGTSAEQDEHNPISLDDVRRHLSAHGQHAYTLIPAEGRYKGQSEDSAVLRFLLPADKDIAAIDVLSFCARIHSILEICFTSLRQKQVVATMSLQLPDRYVSWLRLVSYDGHLVNEPFPLPALISRLVLAGTQQNVGQATGRPMMDLLLARHYKKLVAPPPLEVCDDIPFLFWRTPKDAAAYSFSFSKGWEEDGASQRAWDERIVTSSDSQGYSRSLTPRAQFVAQFQSMTDGPIYCIDNLGRVLAHPADPLPLRRCSFLEGVETCEVLYLDTLHRWLELRQSPSEFEDYLNQERSAAKLFATRVPMIGTACVIRTPSGSVALKRRGSAVASNPGVVSVAPAGMLEPVSGELHPSVLATFIRELDEELFEGPDENQSLAQLAKRPHIAELEGALRYLGFGVDVGRHEPVILLLFQPSSNWWERWAGQMRFNWEFAGSSYEERPLASILSGSGDFVPSTAIALKLAGEFVRGLA